MQIELLAMDLNLLSSKCEDSQLSSDIQQAIGRLAQLEEIVAKINHLVKLVGSRVTDEEQDEEEGPIMVVRLLEETVEFWKSDLFFKHKVALDLSIPGVSPIVVSKERYLKDALDSVLFGCIQVLKEAVDPQLRISVVNESEAILSITFKPIGAGFPIDRVGSLASFIEGNGSLSKSELSFAPLDLSLAVAKMSIEKIAGDFHLNEESIRIDLKTT